MQSPVEVITKILHEGLMNSKQLSLMIEVLECLNPICRVCELDDMKAASGNEMTLVIFLLNDAVKNGLYDLQKSNFVNLVSIMYFYWGCLSRLINMFCCGLWYFGLMTLVGSN
jgi:hypothetical protein